jgi:hypothetical protein
MLLNKKGYFQGGGGVNEPTPGEKKYKSDPAIVVQPRFKEPFYRNYDLYTIPGMEHIGPGTGWHAMQNYKSVEEFLEDRRSRLKPRYVADDSWQIDNGDRIKKNPGVQVRSAIFANIMKEADPNYDLGKGLYQEMSDGKVDSGKEFREERNHGPGAFFADDNDIDFPIDDEVNRGGGMIYPEEGEYHKPSLVGPSGIDDETLEPSEEGPELFQSSFQSAQIAGEHSYVPEHDFAGRSDEALNFGRDYDDPAPPARGLDDILDKLQDKYLEPSETDLFGLPDGIDPNSDLDAEETEQVEQPYTGTSDIGTEIYEDKWNI